MITAVGADPFPLAFKRQGDPFAVGTHPAYLPGRDSRQQGKRLHIPRHDSTGSDEGIAANLTAADNGAVSAESSATPHARIPIGVLAADGRTRIVDVSEDNARAAEDLVLKEDAVIDRYVVLNLDAMADARMATDVDVLPQRTTLTDLRACADVSPVPDATSGANHRPFINNCRWVNFYRRMNQHASHKPIERSTI